jgi:hypothetical protein
VWTPEKGGGEQGCVSGWLGLGLTKLVSIHMFVDDNLGAGNNAGTDEEEGGLEIFRVEVCEQLVGIEALWDGEVR